MTINPISLLPAFNPAEIMNETNVLIAGVTGSGKSNLLNLIIYQIMKQNPEECGVILLDASGQSSGLAKYADLPHAVINSVVYGKDDMMQVLTTVQNIMQSRLDNMTAWDEYSEEVPIYVIIDEFAAVRDTCGKEFDKILSDICRRCRKTRIHVIAATQDPSKKAIPANIVNNFTCRIALRCDDMTQSKQIIGVSGAENLPKNGNAIIKREGHDTEKISVPYLDMEHVRSAVEYWENSGYYVDWSETLAECESDEDTHESDILDFVPPVIAAMPSVPARRICTDIVQESTGTQSKNLLTNLVLSAFDMLIAVLMAFVTWIGHKFDDVISRTNAIVKLPVVTVKIIIGIVIYTIIILAYVLKFFYQIVLAFIRWGFSDSDNAPIFLMVMVFITCAVRCQI